LSTSQAIASPDRLATGLCGATLAAGMDRRSPGEEDVTGYVAL
jgi:hypothetical protein